jgi:hypothetical protein
MKNPFSRRKSEAVVSHQQVPKDFREMTLDEQLEWCGNLLEGLVPLPKDADDKPED